MLLKVISDLCDVTNTLAELVRDLITELEHQSTVNEIDIIEPGRNATEGKIPAIEVYKKRADEAEQLLDLIEYNSRRI